MTIPGHVKINESLRLAKTEVQQPDGTWKLILAPEDRHEFVGLGCKWCGYRLDITITGRLPSSPNLQNIPIRTELGKEIKKAFLGE